MKQHKIYTENGKSYIERLDFPRFKAEITFGQFSDLEKIELFDNTTDPILLAKIMREAADFLKENSKH